MVQDFRWWCHRCCQDDGRPHVFPPRKHGQDRLPTSRIPLLASRRPPSHHCWHHATPLPQRSLQNQPEQCQPERLTHQHAVTTLAHYTYDA